MNTQLNSTQQNYSLRSNLKQNMGFGNRKVPRYIYHLTTKEKWSRILSSGELRPSYDGCMKAVCMADLSNLFGQWKADLRTKGQQMLKDLVDHVQKDNSNLVILKISTEKLKRSEFFLRPQGECFKISKEDGFIPWLLKGKDKNTVPNRKFLLLTEGVEAQNARKYRHKDAIEYVYKNGIPVQNIEKIGETPTQGKSLLEIWQGLLKGTKEEKALINLAA